MYKRQPSLCAPLSPRECALMWVTTGEPSNITTQLTKYMSTRACQALRQNHKYGHQKTVLMPFATTQKESARYTEKRAFEDRVLSCSETSLVLIDQLKAPNEQCRPTSESFDSSIRSCGLICEGDINHPFLAILGLSSGHPFSRRDHASVCKAFAHPLNLFMP